MRESREFYISDDGIRLHLKLDFPQENCDENSDESCGKSGGESFGEGCLALPSETSRTEKTEKAEEILQHVEEKYLAVYPHLKGICQNKHP